jgi:tRNA (cytidine/uridine-2'-O-)-methyltransferase
MQIVLYQPDLAHNLGSIIRLAACFDVPLHVVEPCGFPLDDKRIRQRSLDYGVHVPLIRHASWDAFHAHCKASGGRLILSTTKTTHSLYDQAFQPSDWIMFGRERAGVPEDVHQCSDAHVRIPMSPIARSFNVAMAAAIVLSEAIRQTRHACTYA